jgi:hypothetical protein
MNKNEIFPCFPSCNLIACSQTRAKKTSAALEKRQRDDKTSGVGYAGLV